MAGSVRDLVTIEKEQAINFILVVFAFAGSFVTGVSLLRAFDLGMAPALWAQLILVASAISVAIFRKRLTFLFKIIFAIGINLLVGMAGILNFGMADSSIMLLITAVIVAASLGGTRIAVITVIICAVMLAILMVLVQMSLWTFNVDVNTYIYQLSSWVVYWLAFVVLSLITTFIIGKMSDIASTNMALLEEQSKKLEQANKTKDKLFQMIAHDLRTPFQGLITGLELHLDKDSVFDAESKEKLLRSLLDDSVSTFLMLENLLYWSRAQASDLKLEKTFLDPEKLLLQSLGPYLRAAERKQIKIKTDITPGVFCYGDEGSLKIIFSNLISNAIKFTGMSGEIVITAITVNNKAHIVVSDNGIGVNEVELDKLFELDHVYTSRGTMNESGTGLGLRICRELLVRNNGEIKVKINTKGGSDFTVILPTQFSSV